jgi:hypothetical protein
MPLHIAERRLPSDTCSRVLWRLTLVFPTPWKFPALQCPNSQTTFFQGLIGCQSDGGRSATVMRPSEKRGRTTGARMSVDQPRPRDASRSGVVAA